MIFKLVQNAKISKLMSLKLSDSYCFFLKLCHRSISTRENLVYNDECFNFHMLLRKECNGYGSIFARSIIIPNFLHEFWYYLFWKYLQLYIKEPLALS